MKIKLLAAILSLSSSAVFSNGVLFNVLYAGKAISVPITLCLDGITPSSCETHLATGSDLYVRSKTSNPSKYPTAGIRVDVAGHSLAGCTANGNGNCIFAVNSCRTVHIGLN
jgi:hypothetical protein